MDRVTHIIDSECEVRVTRLSQGSVRIRIVEDQNLPDPTDFEIEGHPARIAEVLGAVVSVLTNIDEILQEPS